MLQARGGNLKAAVHGILGAVEAATGRTVGGAYHETRMLDLMKGGPLMPAATMPGWTRVYLPGALSGMGTSLLEAPTFAPPKGGD